MIEKQDAILEHFLYVLPFLNELSINDVGVALCDREKYLLYKPGKSLDMKATAGTPVKPGTAVVRAMAEKHRIVMRGDKALFGVPYIAVAFPILDSSGEAVGCAALTTTVDLQDNIMQMATTLNDSISILASTTEQISAQAEEIATLCNNLAMSSRESQNIIKETNTVIDIIRNVAKHINLLGLNASIEAARVGEAGRGFGVVAEEIRKLSTSSADSIKKIYDVISTIQADSEQNYNHLLQVVDAINQVATAVSQVAGAVQQSSSLVNQLNSMADNLTQNSD